MQRRAVGIGRVSALGDALPNFAAKNVISSSGENWPTPSARAFTRAAIDTLSAAAHTARLLGGGTIQEHLQFLSTLSSLALALYLILEGSNSYRRHGVTLGPCLVFECGNVHKYPLSWFEGLFTSAPLLLERRGTPAVAC